MTLLPMIIWSALLAMLSVIGVFANAQQPELDGGPAVAREKGYVAQEISDGLYWLSDGAFNTMFLVTSSGVIAVDAPPTLGPN